MAILCAKAPGKRHALIQHDAKWHVNAMLEFAKTAQQNGPFYQVELFDGAVKVRRKFFIQFFMRAQHLRNDRAEILVVRAVVIRAVAKLPAEKGRDLLKQVRSQLVEIARPKLEELVEGITGIKPSSLHHDISTISGEEIVVFTLPKAPELRETKKH